MDEVISDIRKLCDAQSCVILLTDHETRSCRALCESRNEYSMLPSMKGVLREGFYDLTLSWKDTIGVIQAMNVGKQTVTINVELFGRDTPVEISFAEVQKYK